jgi:two-component system chemotaxis response regulator CheB
MIKVLIVEDSPVMQQLLIHTINSDPIFMIVGVANDGEEAIEAAARLHPDVIAMDWYMPKLDGQKATRRIMETNPIPIVLVTASMAIKDVMFSFGIMEAGALAIVKKPHSIDHPEYKKDAKELIQTLKTMSEVKLVRRMVRITGKHVPIKFTAEKPLKIDSEIQVVAIGASTGGPLILQKIILGLPKNIPVPLLIVQHISPGFTKGFAEWLGNTTGFSLTVAKHGEYILPGTGYIAPDGFHMGVDSSRKIFLSQHEPENNLRPSVAYLFRTVANVFGSNAIGILLTGMGRDGADELKLMKDKGAVTIAQDKETCIVYGMPNEAVKLGAAMHVLSPEEIVKTIISLTTNHGLQNEK